jgi:hypothetical protein
MDGNIVWGVNPEVGDQQKSATSARRPARGAETPAAFSWCRAPSPRMDVNPWLVAGLDGGLDGMAGGQDGDDGGDGDGDDEEGDVRKGAWTAEVGRGAPCSPVGPSSG